MDWMKRLALWILRIPALVTGEPSLRSEAREFIKSGEADRIPLRDFEKRFQVTETDYDARIDGFPKSDYYREDDPGQSAKNRKQFEAFLSGQ